MGEAPKKKDRIEELNTQFILDTKASLSNPSKRHRLRPHLTRRRLVLLLPIVLIVSAVAGQNLYEYYGPGSCHSLFGGQQKVTANKVGLLDTLAFEYPDKSFVQTVESSAKLAGQGFEYYTPSTISLDTFVHLPEDGYSMLILRTHIAYSNTTTTALQVAITTSEPYDNYRWVNDQINNRLTNVNINGSYYFGLTPLFVSERMCGRFPGTLVLAMGCYLMNSTDVAGAFLQKGASAVIGWKGAVSLSQTDATFEKLVPLLMSGVSVPEALQQAGGTAPLILGDPVLSYLSS